MSWAQAEFYDLELGDARRTQRLIKLVDDLSAQPTGSIPRACGGWPETKAAYRLLDHPAVDWREILDVHTQRTVERMAGQPVVLCLQDTTELDFTAQPGIAGLGQLSYEAQHGLYGHPTLASLRQACAWLGGLMLAGVHTVLRRARIVWKRARASIRSPDPDYDAKWADVEAAVAAARAQPGRITTVYLDEVTVERQPTVANAYAPTGAQARAVRSPKSNTVTRVIGALNALTGSIFYRRASKITVGFLVVFYRALCRAYPDAERIYVIQDNWPVHTHPDLLVALEPQETRWPWYRPPNWPTEPRPAAIRRWGDLPLPIQIVPLPTYASWCNPIEKLWRKLRQDVTHLHRWADDLEVLRTEIDRFLDQFAKGSLDLLRYVGLEVPD